jgi:glycerol-3-phosphate acyltransferase PlsY
MGIADASTWSKGDKWEDKMMTWQIAALAGLIGYLLGSISFARVINKLVAPDQEIKGIEFDADESGERVVVEAVSGTAVSMTLGAKYGGLTAILDILKVALPTLAIRLAYPNTPYFLITAAMGLIGHNWPLYYRFKGGRGLSAIYGGFLVVDIIGSLVTAIVGMAFGLVVLRNVLVSYMAGLWLMIPWVWFRTRSWPHLAYTIFVNVIFVLAMVPDIRGMMDRKRRGVSGDFAAAMETTPMGRGIQKMAHRIGLLQEKRGHDAR